MLETAIIGGGLCGLALANLLHGAKRDFALFEARERLGGRIHCTEDGHDLGPTWYWPGLQPRITRLVEDLGLKSSPQWSDGKHLLQQEAGGEPTSFEQADVHGGARRIDGGMRMLVGALASRLPSARLHLEHALVEVRDRGTHVELRFAEPHGEHIVAARQIVLAMPPRLVEEKIAFTPTLPATTRQAMRNCPTWMAGQAKLISRHPQAFWRGKGLSGTATTQHTQSVLAETWDAANESSQAALGAFLILTPAQRDAFRDGLDMIAASQLVQLFGAEAANGERDYHDWAKEPHTCSRLDLTPSLSYSNYGSEVLRDPAWNGRLHFGGTETAVYGGGYLEGALESAAWIRRGVAQQRTAVA